MSDLNEIIALAKASGLEGTDLANFIRDERAAQREADRLRIEVEDRERERENEERRLLHEAAEREKEREDKERQRQHELALAAVKKDAAAVSSKPGKLAFKMPAFDEKNDDMDAYITRFEQYSTINGYDKSCWACNLSVQLKGDSLAVFHRMATEDQVDYDKLKETLLRAYRMTEAGYRDKFREAKPMDKEEFSQYVTRLSNYMDRWI